MNEKELEFMRKRYEDAHKAAEKEAEHFHTIIYPSYTNDKKARFWASSIRTQMRTQGDYGFDEETAFSGDYEAFKQQEPQLDDLLEDIAKYLRYEPKLFIRILKGK